MTDRLEFDDDEQPAAPAPAAAPRPQPVTNPETLAPAPAPQPRPTSLSDFATAPPPEPGRVGLSAFQRSPTPKPSSPPAPAFDTDPRVGDRVRAFTTQARSQASHPVLRFENDASEFTKGFLSGIDKTQALLHGAAGLTGSALGADRLRDWGIEGFRRNMAEAAENAPEVESITKVGNLGQLGSWAAYTLGDMIPSVAALFAGGGLGAAAGRALVKRGITDFTTREAQRQLARAATTGAVGGAFAGSFALEGGNLYGEILEETGQDRPGVAAAFGATAAMFDVLPVMTVFRKLGLGKTATEEITKRMLTEPTLRAQFKRTIGEAAKFGAGQAGLEGATEGLQTVIEKAALKFVDENRDIFTPENIDEILNAMAGGALMGGTIGGATGAASANMRPKATPGQPAPLDFEDAPRQVGAGSQGTPAAGRPGPGVPGSVSQAAGATRPRGTVERGAGRPGAPGELPRLDFADETPQEARRASGTAQVGQAATAGRSAQEAPAGAVSGLGDAAASTPRASVRLTGGRSRIGDADLPPTMSTEEASRSYSDTLGRLARRAAIGTNKGRGTPGREYTPEQRAAIERGAFGVKPRVAIGEKLKQVRAHLGTRLRQGVVDQYAAVKDILKDDRAWMMAHLSAAGHGALEAAMDYGQISLKDNAVAVDTSKRSLKQILEPLGAELDDWLAWMAGNRAEGLRTIGKEHRFSADDITALKSLADGKTEDGKSRRALYEVARGQFEQLNDAVLDIAEQTGLIGSAQRASWKAEAFYIPFNRLVDDAGTNRPHRFADGLARQKGVEKIKGADMPLDDLLGNILLNWSHLLSASLRNQAAAKAIKSAVDMDLAAPVSKDKAGKQAIFVREDGREQWYEFKDSTEGALVFDALTSLNYEGLTGSAMKVMRKFKRALTIGVTVDPGFRVANLLRDSLHSPAVVGMSANIVKNVYTGWRATNRKSDLHAAMIAGGGAFGDSGYIHGADPEVVRHLIKDRGITRDTVLDTRNRIRKAWDAYQDFGARMENINRAAAFERALAEGKDLLEANFAARDLLDFSRTGAFPAVRFLTQTVPFLNARMQGLDKMGRALADPKQRKQFIAVVGVYAMASVVLYLAMKDDEDFREAEQWERDTYHLFKLPGSDTLYRLPRPFEVGAIAALLERMTEQVVDDKAHGALFGERLLHALTDTLAFNPIPQAFRPAIELWGNRNMFTDRPIENWSMMRMSPTERRRAWTSDTAILTSRAMDAVSWGNVVLSPVQIEHLVRGYLGWLGATTLGGIDLLVGPFARDGAARPSFKPEDMPGFKRFITSDPPRYTRYLSEFYDNLAALEMANADINGARALGDTERAWRARQEAGGKIVWRKAYNQARAAISRIDRAIALAHASKGLSAGAKRARIDSLQRRKNQIARATVERSRWAFDG